MEKINLLIDYLVRFGALANFTKITITSQKHVVLENLLSSFLTKCVCDENDFVLENLRRPYAYGDDEEDLCGSVAIVKHLYDCDEEMNDCKFLHHNSLDGCACFTISPSKQTQQP